VHSSTTWAGQVAAILTTLMGTIVFALTVGMLHTILHRGDPSGRWKNRQLMQLQDLMHARSVPAPVAEKIQRYFATLYNRQSAIPWSYHGTGGGSGCSPHYLLALPEELRGAVARQLRWVRRPWRPLCGGPF
jgi:hypothetical protein